MLLFLNNCTTLVPSKCEWTMEIDSWEGGRLTVHPHWAFTCCKETWNNLKTRKILTGGENGSMRLVLPLPWPGLSYMAWWFYFKRQLVNLFIISTEAFCLWWYIAAGALLPGQNWSWSRSLTQSGCTLIQASADSSRWGISICWFVQKNIAQ